MVNTYKVLVGQSPRFGCTYCAKNLSRWSGNGNAYIYVEYSRINAFKLDDLIIIDYAKWAC